MALGNEKAGAVFRPPAGVMAPKEIGTMNASYQVRSDTAMQAMFDRALAKSEEQVHAGNFPTRLRVLADRRSIWSVGSRRAGGLVYLLEVDPDGGVTECDCPALGWCWHMMHVERAISGEIAHREVRTIQPAAVASVGALALSGRR